MFYLSWPEFESALLEEAQGSNMIVVKETGYGLELKGPQQSLAFARQVLPNPEWCFDLSINQIAEKLAVLLPDKDQPWIFHSYSVENKAGVRRASLVEDALKTILKRKRKGLLKELNETEGAIVQHVVADNKCSLISYCDKNLRQKLQIVSAPGGKVSFEENKRPPARAYRKLVESLLVTGLNIQSGETVIDLGASPGSWSWVALDYGADVTAIDRSPLVDELMKNKRMKFIKGDAFKYEPTEKVDWLLSDVIADPKRVGLVLEEWLTKKRMKKFVVTMKFRGEKRAEEIVKLREVLDTHAKSFFLRHLENNKNEITAIGVA